MSFSKAKLQRFNDIKPCAPSPAAYNVTVKEKTKSAVLPQTERFIECRSPANSETGTTHSTPCLFRTPSLPKRKKATTSDIKSKPKELFVVNTDLEALKDKIVECENKDAFIKDLSEQIEELKESMSNLEKQKMQLDLNKDKFEQRVVHLKVEHEKHVTKLTEKFEHDICKATEEKVKISNEITLVRKEYEELKDANRKEMEELKKNCDQFQILYDRSVEQCNRLIEEKNTLLTSKEKELRALDNKYIEIQRIHSLEIEKLKKEHWLAIQDIEIEMLKNMTEIQKEKEDTASKIKEIEQFMDKEMRSLKENCEKEKQEILIQSEARVKQYLSHVFRWKAKFKKKSNCSLKKNWREVEKNWKNKLESQVKESDAILKECQAISEYSIIQCELEKNQIKVQLTEKTKDLEVVQLKYDQVMQNCEELTTKFKALQCELNSVIAELNETRRTLGEELNRKKNELKKITEERRAYEVTIKRSQGTIEVLTRRLINSDRDVEQLKKELSDSEEKMLEY
ncbi:hypothetical protein NQ314_011795 [Rhamnusium bicolor]|uniref:Uncharacterized protein n=1 Tax=Rhamnusium bicolor TaxID=1586634 RepID=A0AAV8XGI4_9CUCU|nr:hypothetical protein NQ314_011795 [Rhamnusium bicolor]